MAAVLRHRATLILGLFALLALSIVASPVPTRAAGTVAPNIVNFQTSLGSLPQGGGSVTLTAELDAGATCKLTVSPAISGMASKPSCAGATLQQDVLVPANTTVVPLTYVFTMHAKNAGGKTIATTSVTVAPMFAPTLSDVSASMSELTPAGGTIQLTAQVTGSPVCTIKVSPRLKGIDATPICAGGLLSTQVTIPPNVSTTPVTYVFHLKAKNIVGTARATLSVLVDAIVAPSINGLTVTPSTQPMAGGVVHVQAAVGGGPTCVVKVSPPLPGGPFKPSCISGNLDLPVSLPTNTGLNPVVYKFKVTASNLVGRVKVKTTSTVEAGPLLTISSFDPTEGSISGAGGPVTLAGTLSDASTCKISVTPSISGGPWSSNCAGGSVSQPVTIPQNSSTTKAVTYTFKLTGTNATGSTSAMTQVVEAPLDPSTVTSFTSSASPTDMLGGPVLLSGTVTNALSCAITVSPSIAGAPFGPACASGSLSQQVQLPTNTGSQAITYTFSLTATGLAGASHASTVSVSVPSVFPVLHYIVPQALVMARGYPASLSFCAAVDLSGAVMVRSGDVWSSPVNVDTNQLTEISCASSTYCVAVDASGNVVTFDGTSWSPPSSISTQDLTAVSCASPTSCVVGAVDGSVMLWNGTTWSTSQVVSPYSISGVSCPTSTLCKAVDVGGQVMTFTGSSWTAPIVVTSDALTAISCATTTSCIAVGVNSGTNNVFKWSGTAWTAAADLGGQNGITSVSCPTATMCTAVDDHANAYLDASGVWSAGQPVEAGGLLSGVSCSSAARCVALSFAGASYSWAAGSPTTWAADGAVDVPSGTLVAISCATPASCVVLSSDGSAFIRTDGSWSSPMATGLSNPMGVSCTSSTWCLAVSLDGAAATFDGSSWTPTAAVPTTPPLDTVSCTSPTYCLAASAGGDFVSFTGSAWSAPVTTPVQTVAINGVSCVKSTFCAAISQNGTVWFWDGSSLTSKVVFTASVPGQTISCTRTTFCVAGSRDGRVATWNGGQSWNTVAISNHSIASITCVQRTTSCMALDSIGRVATSTAPGSWSTLGVADTNGVGVAASCSTDATCDIIDAISTTRSS